MPSRRIDVHGLELADLKTIGDDGVNVQIYRPGSRWKGDNHGSADRRARAQRDGRYWSVSGAGRRHRLATSRGPERRRPPSNGSRAASFCSSVRQWSCRRRPTASASTAATPPIGTHYQLYTDDRNVCRVYQMSIGNGEWTLWREGEPVNQRFTATISEDGNSIEGRWEYDEGNGWQSDFDLVYTRVR